LVLKGATDKTWLWVDATDAWTSSEHVNLASGKSYYINGTQVLSGSALGRGTLTGSAVQLNQSRLFLSSTAGLPLQRVAGGGGSGCPNGQVSSGSAGLATDSTHLYWSVRIGTARNNGRGFISRANLNGSNPNQGFSPISINSDNGDMGGLALDDLSPAGSLRPSAFGFGDQLFANGPTAAKEFTLSSTGNAPLTIKTNGIRLTGEDADQFQITDGGDCQAGPGGRDGGLVVTREMRGEFVMCECQGACRALGVCLCGGDRGGRVGEWW
jgi:hypothetical protein